MTTAVVFLSPGVVVSTGVLYSTVVPFGRSSMLPIDFLGSGFSPTLTVWSWGVGAGVTSKVNVTSSALLPALSVALKVIVLVLPTSSAVVVIVIVLIFSVSVFVGEAKDAWFEKTLVPYFARKSSALRLTNLLSFAVTLNSTFLPLTTLWLDGVIVIVGFWTSFAVTFAGSESAPSPFFVTTVTSVPSFTSQFVKIS